jgi:hypothetical protein
MQRISGMRMQQMGQVTFNYMISFFWN